MSEWYDSAVGTAYLAMVMLMGFGSLWLPCAWWWGFNDGLSLWLKSRMGIWEGVGSSGDKKKESDIDLKLFFVVAFVSSPVWGVVVGWLFGPSSWTEFLGGGEVCVGYFYYLMLLYGFLWAHIGGLAGVLACLVILACVAVSLVIQIMHFLSVGVVVLLKVIKNWTKKVLPRTWFLFFLTACIWGSFLARRVVPVMFPLGFYNSICLLDKDTICLMLLSSIVAAFVSGGWIGYKACPPALRFWFFLDPSPATKMLNLIFEGGSSVCCGIRSFSSSVSRNVSSKLLSKLSPHQKKWAFVLLFIMVWGVVCVAGGVYWVGSVGVFEQVWEDILADLFFG